MSNDPFNLQRFVDAQERIYRDAVAELRRGRKQSHWMWFIFPQIHGLGRSSTSEHFAISGLEEARAYLEHPLLGPRLRECTAIVNGISGLSARRIFGSPDDLKLRSSMTLFARAAADNAEFVAALDKYFDSSPDPRTLELL